MGDLTIEVTTFDRYVVGTGTPGDGPFPITFDFDLDAANILVRVQEPTSDEFVLKTVDTDYTVDTAGSRVLFLTTTYEPPTDTVVRLERHTDRDRVLDYEAGATLTAQNLNNENNQEFFILQEIEADLDRALMLDRTGSWWEGEATRSHNCGEATTATGWTTLAQVQAIIEGGDVSDLDDADIYSFTGDGTTTGFELTNYTTLTTQRVFVSINGVLQHVGEPDSASYEQYYSVINPSDTDYPTGFVWTVVQFVNPPATDDEIEVRLIKGSVIAVYGDNTIDGDALADGALDWRHFEDLRYTPQSRVIFNPAAEPTFEDVTSISLFESSLDTWLAAKGVSDFTTFADANLSMNSKRITDLAAPVSANDAARKTDLDGVPVIRYFPGNNLTNAQPSFAVSIGFEPTMVVLQGVVNNATQNYFQSWTAMFGSGRWSGLERVHPDPGTNTALGSPSLNFSYNSANLSITVSIHGLNTRFTGSPNTGITSPELLVIKA